MIRNVRNIDNHVIFKDRFYRSNVLFYRGKWIIVSYIFYFLAYIKIRKLLLLL